MKPMNFPGRKKRRQARAEARRTKSPMPRDLPEVRDIRFRVGRARSS